MNNITRLKSYALANVYSSLVHKFMRQCRPLAERGLDDDVSHVMIPSMYLFECEEKLRQDKAIKDISLIIALFILSDLVVFVEVSR